jgi:hypothetical protein
MVYTGSYALGGLKYAVRMSKYSAEHANALLAMDSVDRLAYVEEMEQGSPLMMPAEELLALMKPASETKLRAGDMVILTGASIHAAPPVQKGEWRPVLFVSGHFPTVPGYRSALQIFPWVQALSCAMSSVLFFEHCVAFWEFQPLDNYYQGWKVDFTNNVLLYINVTSEEKKAIAKKLAIACVPFEWD